MLSLNPSDHLIKIISLHKSISTKMKSDSIKDDKEDK